MQGPEDVLLNMRRTSSHVYMANLEVGCGIWLSKASMELWLKLETSVLEAASKQSHWQSWWAEQSSSAQADEDRGQNHLKLDP